jgi:Lysophospholipase
MREMELSCKDGHRLFFRSWIPDSEPVAVLHLLHGMAEHSLRYDAFARYLNSFGIAVYAQDHRGHGYTKAEDEKGWFADCNGWNVIASDSWELDLKIMAEYPDIPLLLMGHSMGSFLARTMISCHPDAYAAAVICGSGAGKGIAGKVGLMLARRNARKFGPRMPDKRLDKLSFGSYNKKIANPETPFDWLSRDNAEVKKYIDDPLCGFICSSSFFADLITGVEVANSRENARCVSKTLPMLIISGDADPVGDWGEGVKKVYSLYTKAGVRDVTIHLVKGGRHEILNETDKAETMEYIASWLLSKLGVK